MDNMPVIAVFFQSVPEEIVLFSLASVFLGLKMQWKRILTAAVISAFASYLVRHLPISFGFHIVVGVIVNALLIYYFLNRNLFYSFCTSIIVLASLIIAENIIQNPVLMMLGYKSPQEIWNNTFLRVVISYPTIIALAIITGLLHKRKFSLFGTGKNKK